MTQHPAVFDEQGDKGYGYKDFQHPDKPIPAFFHTG